MEQVDRKRLFENDEESSSSRPSKKPMQKLSDSGPLTQQDVVYFKKEAIWRQMKFYKSQVNEVSRELSRQEKQYKTILVAYSLLEAWYSSVISAFQSEEQPAKLDLTMDEQEVKAVLEERKKILVNLLKSSDNKISDENLNRFLDSLTLGAEKEKIDLLKCDLEEKLCRLEAHLNEARKELDRADSQTLKRVAANSQPLTESSKDESKSVENGTSTPESKEGKGANEAQAKELEDLKIEYSELKGGYSSLENRLSELMSKLTSADQTTMELKNRLRDLSEADLSKSKVYIDLLDRNSYLSDRVASADKIREEVIQNIKELEKKDNDYMGQMGKEYEEEIRRLKSALSKAESDLVRIRTARDELLGKQAIMKSEFDNRMTNDELTALNDVLNKRLKELESARQEQYEKDINAGLESLEKPELVKRLQVLNDELKDIEAAFQETREITLGKVKDTADKEGLIKKLTIEKNKADQKYFASMRLKDSLVAENKVLKSQVAKSQELVLKLGELEKNYLSKISLLSKNVDDFRSIKDSAIQENFKLQEKMKQLAKSRELVGKDLSLYKEETGRLEKEKADLLSELSQQRTKESKLDAKLKATESLLLKYRQNNTSSILQEDEKQLEALRSITKCSVCSKNWKNTAITSCGHVFCDNCVQERLAARLRRCPSCNKGFSSNDLLSIHL